jgi:hypothetical protein
VENDGVLGERKNVCLPGVNIPSSSLPSLTEKDKDDLMSFAYQENVDVVSCSLVRCAQDVLDVRRCLEEARRRYLRGESGGGACKSIRVHAKIESIQALHHLDEILSVADGVHVSRGDLGMALPLHKVFLAQKMIITRARMCGKPVVTSTEMLDSMMEHLRPSHAECTDVANAVLDGTDALMLSGETATGLHPIGAVIMMARIAESAESCVGYHDEFLSMRQAMRQACRSPQQQVPGEALASSAVDTSFKMFAKMIIVFTDTGSMPLHVAKYRPGEFPYNLRFWTILLIFLGCLTLFIFISVTAIFFSPGVPIVALVAADGTEYSEGIANQLGSLSRGVHGWTYDSITGELGSAVGSAGDVEEKEKEGLDSLDGLDPRMTALRRAISHAFSLGWIVMGDPVVSLWSRDEDAVEMGTSVGKDGSVVNYVQSVFFCLG